MSGGEHTGDDPWSTLPAEELPDTGMEPVDQWFAVIAFHPDARRVGESWTQRAGADAIGLGRDTPLFGEAPGTGLQDRRVSRDALQLQPAGRDWILRRRPGSSRLRVNGCDVVDELRLAPAQQRAGLVLTLGQRIVVHLRLRPEDESEDRATQALSNLLPGVGRTAVALRRATAAAAAVASDVLLIGPTGTGKEHVARAIHDLSADGDGPWVAVNMAALAADIAPASLFGARKGAYTGADSHRRGYFQQAHGGTLFLDEIADAPPSVQPLLLRALQEREVQILGGETQRVDLRVVAAMESDPDAGDGILRPALRYRLGAREIRLPALAERAEDIGLLAVDFLRDDAGSDSLWSDADDATVATWTRCFETLLLHDWPGNIRELKHVVAQLTASAGGSPRLPAHLRYGAAAPSTDGAIAEGGNAPDGVPRTGTPPSPSATVTPLATLDDEAFAAAWARAGYEVAAMAREYGVSRAAIYRRIGRSPLCRLAADVPLDEMLAVLERCRGDLAATAEHLAVSPRGLATRLRASGLPMPGLPAPGTAQD